MVKVGLWSSSLLVGEMAVVAAAAERQAVITIWTTPGRH